MRGVRDVRGVPWRRVAGQIGRSTTVWAAATLTMLALAALLPDFQLQSADGDSATRVAITAACGAGAFGVLSAVVWPLLVRLLLLVPALFLGLLVFVLNGSLLLLALRINPSGRGAAAPETAVIVAAVMSAVASATGAALAVRDDEAYRRRLHRLAARHPALLTTLAHHPGIGFLLVRSAEHGGVVLGAHGAEVPLADLTDASGPLARFGPGAADAVRRTHSFPHTADIMVNSAYDPVGGEVLAFEEQIGSHGGLGGAQSRPFLLSPLGLSAPAADREELVGAEQVHHVLRRWLRELNGPEVPLTTAAEEEEQAA